MASGAHEVLGPTTQEDDASSVAAPSSAAATAPQGEVASSGLDSTVTVGAGGSAVAIFVRKAAAGAELAVAGFASVDVEAAPKWLTDGARIAIADAEQISVDFGSALQLILRLEGIAEFGRFAELTLSNEGRGAGSSTDALLSIRNPVTPPANKMDPVVVDKSSSRFTMGAGNDRIVLDFDVAEGVLGSIVLSGGAGNDTLTGDEGTQRLLGGAGVDVLTGGADADVFAFRAGEIDGDRITDFNPAEGDRLVFSGFGTAPTVEILSTEIRVTGATGAVETILLG